jgi:3-deoxy-manno-octulosonate cytidylyltransferase (CMP-KDO synthetase)
MIRGDTTRIVVVIPARYASQRLPGKPLADIAGKPMVQHVYERASRARRVDRVLVATDDQRVVDAVHAFGGAAIMTPPTLQSGTDRVAYLARSLPEGEIVVNVQGDEPLLDPAMIDEAARPLVGDSSIVVGTLVRRIEAEADLDNPGIVKVVLDNNQNCLYFSRSAIPFLRDGGEGSRLKHHLYLKHIGLYVYRREFLQKYSSWEQTPLERAEKLEQLRILEHGGRIRATITEFDSVPVDTLDDLERVRDIMRRLHDNP